METNEKRELTPEERRIRKEERRRRQEALKRKKQKKAVLIGSIAAAVVLVVLVIILLISKLGAKGPEPIVAKGSNFVIAIDPGHGGKDTGMITGQAVEKNVTMDICSKLKIMLESQGYDVVMTREEDERLSKEDRVLAVNSSDADLVVSVHCCYSDDSTVSGVNSHYKAENPESLFLAQNIQSALVKETDADDCGYKEGNYTIITETEIPSVLVEVGYLSNAQESEMLAEDSYQNDVAKGIAKGVILSLDRE